jgi:Uma2 family endonuclease
MAGATDKPTPTDLPGEPAWDVARLFPDQGHWSEEDYLALNVNRFVEFAHGQVEVLPMPTITHQLIALFIYRLLHQFASQRQLGMVLAAPTRVRLWPGKYREPDVLFLKAENAARCGEDFWVGADLVVEVVSDDDRRRDLEIKRREYAQAKIPEYWIVDPLEGRITVLRLDEGRDSYVEHGVFARGDRAASHLLSGLEVDVTAALSARV